jgi:hypothetical protein
LSPWSDAICIGSRFFGRIVVFDAALIHGSPTEATQKARSQGFALVDRQTLQSTTAHRAETDSPSTA